MYNTFIVTCHAKNAKMRKNENSRNLSKIEWPPVQSLLVLGY